MTPAPASPPDQLADAEGTPLPDRLRIIADGDLRTMARDSLMGIHPDQYDLHGWADLMNEAADALTAAESAREAAVARAERAETSRDAGATKLADELEGWFHRGSYRPGDHLPSSWQYDLGGRIARNMRLVLRALRSCPDAALAPPATAEET